MSVAIGAFARRCRRDPFFTRERSLNVIGGKIQCAALFRWRTAEAREEFTERVVAAVRHAHPHDLASEAG
jgi:hypothetical protein